jgi:cell wall-associated NlpC family hydrolase
MNSIRLLLVLAAAAIASACLAQDDRVVLGKLGQAIRAVPIKANMSDRSKTYYKVKPYEYLVIRTAKYDSWLKVLLHNGSFGYVRSDAIARLPYELTADNSPPARDTGSPSSRGAYVAQRGLDFKGVRYKWGGVDPQTGIDCSAFVRMLYGEVGQNLPRTAAEQALVGTPIRRLEDLRPGDRLYFWSSSRGKIGHTGVYLGDGYFVHSSSGKGGVSTDFLGAKNWLKTLVAARRSA